MFGPSPLIIRISGLILGFLALLGSACQRPTEIDLNPRIISTEIPVPPYILEDEILKFKVQITALDGFKFFRIQEIAAGVLVEFRETDFPSATILDSTFSFSTSDYSLRDTLQYEMLVSDQLDRTGSKRINYVISLPVEFYSTSLFAPGTETGIQDRYLPTFIELSSYGTFTYEGSENFSERIDLGVAYNDQKWFIGSPADSFYGEVLVPEVSTWPVRNELDLYETDLSPSDFNAASTDGIVFETLKNNSLGTIRQVQVDQVISFVTRDSLAGLGLIKSLDTVNGMGIEFKVARR